MSGCSFTHDGDFVRWPYHVQRALDTGHVIDYSRPGAGNQQISNSIVNHFETHNPGQHRGLVIVMWSGYDRDDIIGCSTARKTESTMIHNYNQHAVWLGTGGEAYDGNAVLGLRDLVKQKNHHSRALQNYFIAATLWHYLSCYNNLDVVFTEHHGTNLFPEQTNFDPEPYLPQPMATKFHRLMREVKPNFGDFSRTCYAHDSIDGFHPGPQAHQTWSEQILIPHLRRKFGH